MAAQTKKKQVKKTEPNQNKKLDEAIAAIGRLNTEVKSLQEAIVNKDALGIAVPNSFSPSSPSPAPSNPQTPNVPSSASTGLGFAWPAPERWYQEGSEAAKKAFYEYLNAAKEYQLENQDMPRKLEYAAKMNIAVASIIQGVQIATEAAEKIQARERMGDQAAKIEMEVVRDVVTKMLKTMWIHNTVAESGKAAGLEIKLLDGQIVGRLNRATGLNSVDKGARLDMGEDPDALWASEPPASPPVPVTPTPEEQNQIQEEQGVDGEAPPEEQALEQEIDGEQGIPDELEEEQAPEEEIDQEESQLDENGDPITEEGIPEEETETPESEVPADESEILPEEEQLPTEEEQQLPTEEELQQEAEMPPDEGQIEEEPVPEESPDEGDNMEDFISDDGEDEPPEEEQIEDEVKQEMSEEKPETSAGGEETTSEETPEEQQIEDEIDEEEGEKTEEPVETPEENKIEEEVKEEEAGVDEDADSEDGEEESVYCVECNQTLTPSEMEACENPNCPFKKQIEDDLAPSVPEVSQKHFILIDKTDHSKCRIKKFRSQEQEGITGEYCLDCKTVVQYEFNQKSWDSEQAINWVKKKVREDNLKTKSATGILYDMLSEISDDTWDQWNQKSYDEIDIDWEEKSVSSKEDEFDLDLSEEDIKKVLDNTIGKKFGSVDKRLKQLGL